MTAQQQPQYRQNLESLDTDALHRLRKEKTTEWFVSNRLNGRISPQSVAIKREIDELSAALISKAGGRSKA